MRIVCINHNGEVIIHHQIRKSNINENERLKKEKTVSDQNICYHFKHQQLNQSKRSLHGEIYEIWLYHQQQQHQPEYLFDYEKQQIHQFKFYLSSDINYPNGESFNSLKLMGN